MLRSPWAATVEISWQNGESPFVERHKGSKENVVYENRVRITKFLPVGTFISDNEWSTVAQVTIPTGTISH